MMSEEARAARPATRKPKLPRELYATSTGASLLFIVHGLVLHYGAGLAIFYTLRSELAWWVMAPIAFLLALVAGQGLHTYGLVGHQAFHGAMFRSKRANLLTGIALSSTMPGFFCVVGYYASHWNHHLYTNTSRDPDTLFSNYRSLWSKLFLLRFVQNAVYRNQTMVLARGNDLPFASRLPIPREQVTRLARLNLALCLAALAAHIALFVASPLLGLSIVLLPIVGVFFVSGARPYLEHGNLGVGEGLDSRSRTSLLSTFFYFANNYHLEHHLYPSVPCYNLGRVHRFLRESGYFEGWDAPIEPSLLGGLRHMFDAYPMGQPGDRPPVVSQEDMDPAPESLLVGSGQLAPRG
jgi:beta-carotene hydroxylase